MATIKVKSEVIGTVWRVEKAVGAEVAAGDTVLILESMKMEIPVAAPEAGKITEITVIAEESVEEGQVVCVIESQG
jgi:acetyl-CoA carboxylase biotin carboxyl carrier protein